jgi:hypothetical protein
MDPRIREDDGFGMDPRIREDDGLGMDPRIREDDGLGMDPRVREDDTLVASFLRPFVIPAQAGIHPRFRYDRLPRLRPWLSQSGR